MRGKGLNKQTLTIAAAAFALLVAAVLAFGEDLGLYGTAGDEDQCANIDGVQSSVPDGMIKDGDNCIPDPNIVAQADNDGDGVVNANDACPDQGDQGYGIDATGCPLPPPPPPDADSDGVPDDTDACPNQGDQGYGLDATGCPNPAPQPMVQAAVNAGFEATIGGDGTVQFTDTSSATGGLTISSWAWNFGDGETDSQQNPSHKYASAGTYTVTLTVTANDGTTSTATGQVTITESQVPTTRCAFSIVLVNDTVPLTVNFVNESSNVTSYSWNFGDGSPASAEVNPSHVYQAVGTYDIVLTCTSPVGTLTANGQVSATQSQAQTPLVAQFTATPATGPAPLSVQFTNTSQGNPVSWSWNFGDGTTSTDQNPVHTFSAVGVYTITLTVTNQAGQTATATGTIEVVAQPVAPVPDFTASPRSGNAPLTVTVADATVGTVTSWSWTFGDGVGTATGPGPHTYTYQSVGTYTITLTVNGPNGGGTATKQIVVIPAGAVVDAQFTYQVTGAVTGGYQVCFTDASVGPVASRSWAFGDSANGTSTETNPCYVYAAQGNYPVTLSVTGTGGETSTASKLVAVFVGLDAPKAAFTVNSTSLEVGQQVITTNQSTGVISSFAWDFGDGTTSTEQNPTHTYAQAGTFTISLRVTGPGGTSEAATTQVTVGLPTVSCQISGSTTVNYFDTRTFTANVTGLGGRAATMEWTFNGQTTTGQSFSQQFTQAGSFPLSLNVVFEGQVLCSASTTITVREDSLECSFGGDTTPRLDQRVTYNGSISGLNGRTIASQGWTLAGSSVGSGSSWTNTWNSPGPFDLTYSVTLSDGATCEATRTITVSDSTLECSISGSTTVNPFETRTYQLSIGGSTTGVTYNWTVNGQPAGTTRNISYTFGEGGITYTFTAEILKDGQVACSASRTVTTRSQDALTCSIGGAKDMLLGEVSNLTGNVSNLYSRTATYEWKVGDTVIGSDQNMGSYTWSASGSYLVTFTVTPSSGSPCVSTRTIKVLDSNVVCSISGPSNPRAYVPATWSGSINSLLSGLTSSWLIDNAPAGSGSSLTTFFSDTNQHTLTLQVFDGTTMVCQATKNVRASQDDLSCSIGGPNSLLLLQDGQFTANVNNLRGRTATYDWQINGQSVGTSSPVTVSFNQSGAQTLTLIVTPSTGLPCTATRTVQVAQNALECAINGNFSPFAGQQVSYSASVQGLGDQTATYQWTLNGQVIGTTATLNHVFNAEGSANLVLTVKGSREGVECSVTGAITVQAGQSINATATPNEGSAPQLVTFTAQTNGIDRSTLTWYYPDGSFQRAETGTFFFTQEGTYTVRVTGTGVIGEQEASVVVVISSQVGIRAAFTPNPWGAVAPYEICFTDRSVSEFSDLNSWTWDFGDGAGTSTEQNPCYTYTNTGSYTVTLRVTNTAGLQASASNIVRLFSISEGRSSFGVELKPGREVCFTSFLGEGLTVDHWEFGNGQSSTEPNPCVIYEDDGDYTVTLFYQGIDVPGSISRTIKVTTVTSSELPQLTVTAECVEPGLARFTITNTGGAMSNPDSYVVLDSQGNTLDSGNILLNKGESLAVTVQGEGSLTLATTDSQLSVSTECAEPPSLSVIGQCSEDGSLVVFTLTNAGGPMPAGVSYTITGPDGEVAAGTTSALDAGASQDFSVPAVPEGQTLTFSADSLSQPVTVEGCAMPQEASLRVTKAVNGQITGVYAFEICVKGPSLDECVMLSSGQTASFDRLQPGVYTISEPNAGAEWNVEGTGDVEVVAGAQASVTVTNTPTECQITMVDASGRPITIANPALCVPVTPVQTPAPLVIAPPAIGPVCPDWFVYHTLQTGNVEVFRLGELPDNPGADDNLTKGENADPRLAYDQEPSRSPDSAWIVFASNRTGGWELWRGTTDGEQQEQLTFQPDSIEWDPAWSPRGDLIVYDSSRDGNWNLYLLDLATGQERQLTSHEAADINGFWHPNGTTIVFQSNRDGLWQLYTIDIVTGQEQRLSDGSGDDFNAQYSSDGSQITFLSFRDGTPNRVLYVMNADGSNVRAISDPAGDVSSMAFSGDDELIAYTSNLADANGSTDRDIYVYEFATGATRLLTDNAIDDYAPTWRCESHAVIFTSAITGDANVFEAPAEPLDAAPIDVLNEAAQLTFDVEDDYDPQSSPAEENASQQNTVTAPSR